MPSKQTARRATAKARSSARSQATMPNDSAKGAGKGQNATPQLRWECCDAGGCACAQQRLDDLRASFGHAIQGVFDHAKTRFLCTPWVTILTSWWRTCQRNTCKILDGRCIFPSI
eukprot:7932994-Pyramimonas_sp.AAC.1